jgi:hypothetical protein
MNYGDDYGSIRIVGGGSVSMAEAHAMVTGGYARYEGLSSIRITHYLIAGTEDRRIARGVCTALKAAGLVTIDAGDVVHLTPSVSSIDEAIVALNVLVAMNVPGHT